jgi:hypothetical protein
MGALSPRLNTLSELTVFVYEIIFKFLLNILIIPFIFNNNSIPQDNSFINNKLALNLGRECISKLVAINSPKYPFKIGCNEEYIQEYILV